MSEPWNLVAEQIIIGGMMLDRSTIMPVAEIVDDPDFYRPAHGLLFDVITRQYAADLPCDPVAIGEVLTRQGEISRTGGHPYLHTLIASVPVAANAVYFARIVAELSLRRKIIAAGIRMTDHAADQGADVADILTRAEADLASVTAKHQPEGVDVMNIAAFVAADMPFCSPVIPGLLHEQERVVVVAPEGYGKTELALQAAVMTAAGLHVFTGAWIPALTSLIIDLENPRASVMKRLARLMREAEEVKDWNPDRCQVWSKPGGIDLRDPSDQRLLLAVIAKTDPRLIVAGPAYKMSIDRGERAEQLHSSVTAFWDKIRERHGSALWIEAHAPLEQGGKRSMRPMGSGIWSRWPEFGLALLPCDDEPGALRVSTFRGHREDRVWPARLRRSRPWSWRGVYPAGTFDSRE